MKKYSLLVAIVFLFPIISFGAFENDLKYGSAGGEVSELQEFLTDSGFYSGPITGNFYSLTQSAVKRFQLANGISPVSGYFGPISRARANELISAKTSPSEDVASTNPPEVVDTPSKIDELLEQIKVLTEAQNKANETKTALGSANEEVAPIKEVKKELYVSSVANQYSENSGAYSDFYVSYKEDGKAIIGAKITVSADDSGYFNYYNGSNNVRGVGSVTGIATKSKGVASFQYIPKEQGKRTITITSNGVSTTTQADGIK